MGDEVDLRRIYFRERKKIKVFQEVQELCLHRHLLSVQPGLGLKAPGTTAQCQTRAAPAKSRADAGCQEEWRKNFRQREGEREGGKRVAKKTRMEKESLRGDCQQKHEQKLKEKSSRGLGEGNWKL